MSLIRLVSFSAIFLVLFASVPAQELPLTLNPGQSMALFSAGVSYDILRDPTDVSFEYPEGYLSLNIPISPGGEFEVNEYLEESVEINKTFSPKLGATQKLNLSYRVNVPMLKGVFSFATTNNVEFGYQMTFGNTSFNIDSTMSEDDVDTRMVINGYMHVPVNFYMGWQTQTFGYAFRPLRDVTVGINLHRNIFEMRSRGKIASTIFGAIDVNMDQLSESQNIPMNFDTSSIGGYMEGKYSGESWTPAFAVKYGRFRVTSRFGLKKMIEGNFKAKYAVPFFIDPVTFEFNSDELNVVGDSVNLDSIDQIMSDILELKEKTETGQSDSVTYLTENAMEFEIPQGHTFTFDIIRDGKLSISYSKIFGTLSLFHEEEVPVKKKENGEIIYTYDTTTSGGSTVIDSTPVMVMETRTDIDFGFDIDHILTLNGKFNWINFRIGTFGMDFNLMGENDLLSDATPVKIGNRALLPILGGGVTIGSVTRLILQADILPLPSIKTGVVYYF
ncbi:MAG: hypothetical protein ACLFQK_01990 [Fibrobacterota bacterium]